MAGERMKEDEQRRAGEPPAKSLPPAGVTIADVMIMKPGAMSATQAREITGWLRRCADEMDRSWINYTHERAHHFRYMLGGATTSGAE